MLFEWYGLWLAKDTESPEHYEDAYEVNASRGFAAIADGVASAIFSRHWAYLLTQSIVDEPPDPNCPETFGPWLAARREEWEARINLDKLGFFQRMKLAEVGGGFATLLWIQLAEMEDTAAHGSFRLRATALGDCCLFHVRNGQSLTTFPITAAGEFDLHPHAVSSRDRRKDHLLEFRTMETVVEVGDVVVLTTDAMAKWAFDEMEANRVVDWEALWNFDQPTWNAHIESLRQGGRIRYDDTTVILLRPVIATTEASVSSLVNEQEQFDVDSSPDSSTEGELKRSAGELTPAFDEGIDVTGAVDIAPEPETESDFPEHQGTQPELPTKATS